MRLLFIAWLLSAAAHAGEPPLRFSVSDSWGMPMMQIDDGRATAGILYDLQARLARKVGRRAEQLVLPRLRVQRLLARGEIDVRCYVHPAWLAEPQRGYVWSVPFMVQQDLIVGRWNAPELRPERLRGERLGTVLGFRYPRLEPLFASGQLQRDDARTQELALQKLDAGRYRYAVSSHLALDWFNRQQPAGQRLKALQQIAADPISCLIRDAADVPTRALLRALVQMKQNGELEAILARYR